MIDIRFTCTHCSQHISCDPSNSGRQIQCPACKTTLTVPQPATAAPVAAPGLSIAASQARSHAASQARAHAAPPSTTQWAPSAPGAGAAAIAASRSSWWKKFFGR